MKTFLIACVATAALATTAFAQDIKPTTAPGDLPGDHKTQNERFDSDAKTIANDRARTAETKDSSDGKSFADTKSSPSNDQGSKSVSAAAAQKEPVRQATQHRPNVRHAEWKGGHGSSWKTGRNRYGFQGSFGGCRYHGFAGPNGYHIEKSC